MPWLAAVDLRFRQLLKNWTNWAIGLGVGVGCGIAAAVYLDVNSSGRDALAAWGRSYSSILHLQIAADLLVLVFWLMLQLWPKGGAVAQAAFREGLRQPLFWVLILAAGLLMGISPILPYFTFENSEELKMVKNLCYNFTMLSALFFGVVSAAIFVHEEIEGRTAITVMSKPISRRQFFLGKFAGILLSALAMTILVSWFLVWVILFKLWYDNPAGQGSAGSGPPDPFWLARFLQNFDPGNTADLVRGLGLWVDDALAVLPGIVQGFCQVMVLTALSTALATRLPMVVNLTFCLAVYFLGNLAPIMVAVTKREYRLLNFVAQVFQTILPGLDLFDVSTYVTRDVPLPPTDYALYTLQVVAYAITYSAIALLLGLILFEDRDLA